MVKFKFFLAVFLLVLMLDMGYSRFIKTSSSELVSDGLNNDVDESPYLLLKPITSSVTCTPMYGFLPCTTNLWGQLFLIVIYQYLLFLGERYVSAGSDLMFRILGPGIFGASAFQILGALPEAALVLASGVYGTKEAAQDQVVNGVGILAGSTVFLLTLLWGTCLVVGTTDLSTDSSTAQTAKPLSLIGSGVTADLETRYTARIMILSTIAFIIAQLPHIFGSTSGGRVSILIALIVSLTLLFLYIFYQVFQPRIQSRRLEYMMHNFAQNTLLQSLLTNDGKPNTPLIKELFKKIDLNKDLYITPAEIKGLILGIQFEEIGLNNEDFVDVVLKDFDTSGDAHIDEKEFVRGISKWLSAAHQSNDKKIRNRWHLDTNTSQEEQALLVNQGNKNVQNVNNTLWTFLKAVLLLVLGTAILAVLGTPLINSVVNFSNAANIPPIFISFIVVPMVVNYRESVSAITSIRRKKQQSASLTLSEIYTAAFMNNVVGLSIFLGIVYARGLVWEFSAEVLVVVIVCLVMGLFTSFCKKFPLWTSFIAYLLYPFSLMLLYVLTYTYGWN